MNPAWASDDRSDQLAEAVVGASVFNVIAPEDRAAWKANHERVCNGEKLAGSSTSSGAAGTRLRADTHAVPLRLPDNTWAQLAVTRDITRTQRHRAERQRKRVPIRQLLLALPMRFTRPTRRERSRFIIRPQSNWRAHAGIGFGRMCVTWRLYQSDGTLCPMTNAPWLWR